MLLPTAQKWFINLIEHICNLADLRSLKDTINVVVVFFFLLLLFF